MADQVINDIGTFAFLFSAAAAEAAAAARQAAQLSAGQNLSVQTKYADYKADFEKTPSSHTITLQVVQSTASGNQQAGSVIASLAFDIILAASDALPQRASYAFRPRQTLHQTMDGYYIDEFGMGPGHLRLEARVVFRSDNPTDQIQAFRDALRISKSQTPLSPTPPPVTKFHDAYLGQSYIITITNLEFEENTDILGMAHVSLDADILNDYSATTPTSSVSQPSAQQAGNQGYVPGYSPVT